MEFGTCECVDKLIEAGFLTTALSLDMKTGKTEARVVLAKLVEGKSGRLNVKPQWFLINNCPNCGKSTSR